MRLRLALVAVVVLQVVLPLAPAGARVDGQGETVNAWDRRSAANDRAPDPPPPPADPPRPRRIGRGQGDRLPVPAIIFVAGTGACMSSGSSSLITEPLLDVAFTLPGCPASAGAAGGSAPPPPTPLEAAYQAWYWMTKLPSPTLATSPPNGAVTGLDLYLSIGGPQTMTYDVAALGYMVHLDVTSVYDVSWGDPRPDSTPTGQAVTRNHATQGGPYPTGDLRHQYIERGRATIDVTQKWTAQWSAGGQSGTIADRLSTSGTVTIPVEEIQAVLRP